MGMIEYKDLVIKINKDMPQEAKKETICHEMIHGILVHLGYTDMANDEQLVQALGNAIYQGFEVKEFTKAIEPINHDGCVGCKYEKLYGNEHPCCVCKSRFMDRYKPKKEQK